MESTCGLSQCSCTGCDFIACAFSPSNSLRNDCTSSSTCRNMREACFFWAPDIRIAWRLSSRTSADSQIRFLSSWKFSRKRKEIHFSPCECLPRRMRPVHQPSCPKSRSAALCSRSFTSLAAKPEELSGSERLFMVLCCLWAVMATLCHASVSSSLLLLSDLSEA